MVWLSPFFRFFETILYLDTKIKIDIFSHKPYIPFDPINIDFEGYKLKLRNQEDQLATQIIESSGVFTGSKISPKWLENIEGLLKISDMKLVEKYYRGKGNNPHRESATELYEKIKLYLKDHTEQLIDKPTRREAYKCESRQDLNGFKVEPMEKIYKLLGYAE
ncbi:MAG: hypothetical protein AAB443_00860 [Patescibacteria group bacterium]